MTDEGEFGKINDEKHEKMTFTKIKERRKGGFCVF